jgi:hypothetical protein
MFILVCIVLNTAILACTYYEMPQELIDAFEKVNYTFMIIFTLEAIVKLVALKKLYFKDSWNIFDFTVVVFTAIVVGVSFIPGGGIDLKLQATLIRVLRILRVLRIIKKLEKLQIIFMTILNALPSMSSLAALLIMFLFLFSIIGM